MNDPHYANRIAQIGNICVQWSALEYHTAIAIWNLAGVVDQEIGKILTANLDLKQRVGMAFALAHTVNAPIPFKNAIKALQTALQNEDLIHRRNQAVHGIHFQIDEPGAAGIEMHRGKGGRVQRIQRDKDLNQLGARLAELRDSFLLALTAYVANLHADAVASIPSVKEALAIIENIASTNSRGDDKGPE
ncbi:hypothetical protein [Novosphingobium sp.]|uniref:hypothetical protein n=1 Tax=Novosphingobium sp. TaxID=1874826 RepID=UPI0025DC63D9|nr:hypothetical protein [Novosphingobium sp.]MCC6925716.1 hypothetical protein [Novosphingobium sp.]